MDDKTLMMILVAFATIAFFVFVYLASKTWTIAHIVMTVLVYFASLAFLILAAATLKTHAEWRGAYNKLLEKAGNEEAAIALLKFGTVTFNGTMVNWDNAEVIDPLLKNKLDIRELQAKIDAIMRDRGRVWRGITPNVGGTSIVLNLETQAAAPVDPMAAPPADPMAPMAPAAPAGPASPHGIRVDALLYAFREVPVQSADQTQQFPLPYVYLGEFVVTAVSPTSVTVTATPASQELAPLWRAVDATGQPFKWTVYETVPGDQHQFFAGMDDAKIRALIPKPNAVPADIYERRIREYTHHGQKADPTDPPDQVWKRVKFTRKLEIEVDAKGAAAVVDAYFNATGQALPMLLHQGQKLTIDPGVELLLERSVAKKLIEDGSCTELGEVFVRRLHDYEYMFRDFLVRRANILRRTAIVQADTKVQTDSAARLQVNITARTAEIGKLKLDQAGFVRDGDMLKKYSSEVAAKRAQLLAELSLLYNQNNDLAARIAQMQIELAKQIEKRVAAAAEGAATPAPSPTPMAPPATPAPAPAPMPAPPATPMAAPAPTPPATAP